MWDLPGAFCDEAGLGDVLWPGSTFRCLGFGAAELSSNSEALLDDLIGCLAVEDALAAGVVGGVEAPEQPLQLGVRPNGDAQHAAAHLMVLVRNIT